MEQTPGLTTHTLDLKTSADKHMKVEVLVAALEKDPRALAEQMNIDSDCLIVNQCDSEGWDEFTLNGHTVRVLSMKERGVGISRNAAIDNSTGDILLFSDQDIVYEKGYEEAILKEFEVCPEADMMVFNILVDESRRTYFNTERKRVHLYNCGRYGAVSFAIKKDVIIKSGINYSLLFGGGAKYSAGEDSLFISDVIKGGYKVFTAPVTIGREAAGNSTWFKGYNEKFFFDRGVLYHFLYGKLARVLSLRFLFAHKATLCSEMSLKEAYGIMVKGIKQGKEESK